MRFAFAGDRQIAVNILNTLMLSGHKPLALLVSSGSNESHAEELIQAGGVDKGYIFAGKDFTSEEALVKLNALNLDYIIGIHFPYIIPSKILELPKIGVLNLHPSYLPFNKGWHTPSWAILSKKPYGATLHFMAEALDAGDIIEQEQITLQPNDTANSLYKRVLVLEEEVFEKALPKIISLEPRRYEQQEQGTSNTKKDLRLIQEIKLDESTTSREVIDRLRALTTNNIDEAAFFEEDGKRYAVQVQIEELKS